MSPTRFSALRRLLELGHARNSPLPYLPPENTHLIHAFLAHGILSTQEALTIGNQRRGLTLNDHLGQSLLQFEYFQHIWRHRGEGLLGHALRQRSRIPYQSCLPADIRTAATGIPPIDNAIRELYRSGEISARQQGWIASYAVNMRKVDWRVGAHWMYGHLLTGSMPGVHLEWHRVAGVPGQSPVVYGSEDMLGVYKSTAATQLDQPRDALLRLAESPDTIAPEALRPLPQREPKLYQHPIAAWCRLPPPPTLNGRAVQLVHPWALGASQRTAVRIAIIHLPFHLCYPWSEARWRFVLQGMERNCDALWIGDLARCRQWLEEAHSVRYAPTNHPAYSEALAATAIVQPPDKDVIPEPGYLCASFEIYLQAIRQLRPELFERSLRGQVAQLRATRSLARPKALFRDS